ncbi:hypothetical protein [Nocardioides sp. SYSU DS0663]|uniref:hypothetical protein n=1 Tax=Nocardioides sp. SYSU DS0663 TaxID=3416445 RepID=UPI003F4B27E5
MKKSFSRAIAATAVSAVGMAGALVATPTATADPAPQPSARANQLTSSGKLERTGFAYKADVFGTKVLLGGVELRGLKDGYAQQRCTALAGRSVNRESIVSIPDEIVPEGLIDISLTEQSSETYRLGDRTGVRGISTIGAIEVGGGELPGVGPLPKISIKGLTSVADAFNQGGKYGTKQSFGFDGLEIDLTQDNPISDTLEVLLDTLGLTKVVDVLEVTVNQLLTTILEIVRMGLGDTIVIPGLGEIGLGFTKGQAGKDRAISEAYALKISLFEEVAGQPTSLQLGRARTYLGEAGPAGVFRGTATGANLLGDLPLVNLGNLGQRAIPCDGTNGRVVTKKAGDFSLAGGLVEVDGVTYKYMGDHLSNGGAKALIGTTLGAVRVPSLDLEIKGLSSLVKLRRPAHTSRVKRQVETDYLQILHKGQPISLSPGQSHDLGDGNLLQLKKLIQSNRYGVGVDGLALKLANIGILDLATSAGRIFAR